MKLKAGMYVRTKNGDLFILDKIDDNLLIPRYVELPYIITEEDVIKASYNIIDLIKPGDYVNGRLVTDIHGDRIYTFNSYSDDISNKKGFSYMLSSDIKSIVTHEQFESMKYEVE